MHAHHFKAFNHRFFSLVLFSALVLSAGCGRLPYPEYPAQDPSALLEARHRLPDSLRALRAEARLEQRSGGKRIRGTILMMIERPKKVRFDALTRLGAVATLTSDGEAFALVDLREERFFFGEACPENIARGIGIRLEPSELVALLLGDLPELDGAVTDFDVIRGGYRIALPDRDGGRVEIDLALLKDELSLPPSAQRVHLKAMRFYSSEGVLKRSIRFGSHRTLRTIEGDEALIPREIEFVDREERSDLLFRYQSIEPLEAAPEGAFEQRRPSSLRPEILPCERPPSPAADAERDGE